jgi:uncharacterized protein YqeY
MNLKEKIDSDLKNFLRAKNELGIMTLRLLKSALHNEEIALRKKELKEEETITVINREAKKRKEAILAYEKGGRQDLAEKEKRELAFLNNYLPEQLSEEEIKKSVQFIINKNKDGNLVFGRIMGEVMKEIKGRADGKIVNQVVKEMIDKKEGN